MSNSTLATLSPGYLEEYCGSTLVGVSIAFTVLELFFVALRFAARRIGKIGFAVDDVLLIAALILCLAINSVALAMVQYTGVGHHILYVESTNPTSLVLWAKFLIVESFLYLVAVVLPKLAILAIYHRVFPTTPIRITCYVLAGIMILGAVIGVLMAGLECQPFEYFWDKSIPGGHCLDIHKLYMWASFPNIFTDLVMLVLPLPMIWRLQTSKHIKLGLTLTFLTGSIGLAASIARFVSFTTIDPLVDGTWASVILMTWTVVEPGAYVIAACLPTLRPLVVKCWNMSSTAGRTGAGTTSTKRASGMVTIGAGGGSRRGARGVVVGMGRDDEYFELVDDKRSQSTGEDTRSQT